MSSISESEVPDTQEEPPSDTYSQWIRITIQTESNCFLSVKNAYTKYGKFYECPENKGKELSLDDIDKIMVPPSSTAYICACGRSGSPSGTNGGFDLYGGKSSPVNIGTFTWDCPYGSSKNSWSPPLGNKEYAVQISGGSQTGAIGDIQLIAYYLG